MKTCVISFALLAFFVTAPTTALAQTDEHPCIPPLIRILHNADANGDGQVTFEELGEMIPDLTEEMFDHLDANDDGVLSREDITRRARRLHRLLRKLQEADTNHDCNVNLEEFLAGLSDGTEEQFDRLDRNDDDLINREDCLPICWPDDLPCLPPLLRVLREADANEDGQVTFEELVAAIPDLTQETFDRLDANDDGVLSADDVGPLARRINRLLMQLREVDANADCSVDLEEFLAGFPDATEEQFNHLDRNGDGLLNREDCLPICWPHDDTGAEG